MNQSAQVLEAGNIIETESSTFIVVLDIDRMRLVNVSHPEPFVVHESFDSSESLRQWVEKVYQGDIIKVHQDADAYFKTFPGVFLGQEHNESKVTSPTSSN